MANHFLICKDGLPFGFFKSKAISISLNELHNVNKNQLELLNQRVKGRVNSASAVSTFILLTKRLQLWVRQCSTENDKRSVAKPW